MSDPVAPPPSSSPSSPAAAPPRPPGPRRRSRVLVVEDEALIALDLERRLIRSGYDVVGIADTRDDAVALFQEASPDLVLMDIHIRGPADGIDTAQAIGRLSDVPVIFLTAFADEETIRRASATSPYGYLLKPFDERTLSATVTVALERHAADTRLRVLGAAVEAARVGIVLVDARGDRREISFCNDAFAAISGVPREAALGRRPCFLASDEDLAQQDGLQALSAAIQDRTPATAVIRARRATGEAFWSSVTISPVPSRAGELTHLIIFHLDITRQREAESALAESQRLELVGRLTAGIAHDMNNVLGTIVAFADLARDGLGEDEERRGDLDEVVHAARSGALLTRKLLDFSRRDESGPTGTAELGKVLGATRAMAERLAGPTVAVQFALSPAPLVVRLDATSLEQIILNLVANARDAMPGGGRIDVRTVGPDAAGAPAGYARVEVTDTGSGMDAATIAKIFDPFFTTKPRGVGTGLGLSTCRMLVERAGGSIQVRSAPGEGTTFTLEFPLTAPVLAEGVIEDAAPRKGSANGAICLLVEDETALRRAAARALTEAGFHVFEAASGEAACRELDILGDTLDLLVCDMVLPQVGGAVVLDHARRTSPRAARLVVTGYFADDLEALGEGVTVLWKPYTAGTLARWALDAIRAGAAPLPVATEVTAVPGIAPARRSSSVLLLGRDDGLQRTLAAVLRARRLEVELAADLPGALAAVSAREVELVVIDVPLPTGDGAAELAALRAAEPALPVLVLAGGAHLDAARRGLRGLATSFIAKPVVPGGFIEQVERAIGEGRITRLQHRLRRARAVETGQHLDLAATEQRFEAALRGLSLVYQPIVRAADGAVAGYEALVRCDAPALGAVEIVAAAEALGRIEALGRTVRQLLAADIARHPDPGVLFSVNLHPVELRSDLLLREDEPLLAVASRVVLEVTERAQLASATDVPATFRKLRDAGFRVAIDDLGEGYTGLSWLVRLAPEVAKLDMALVHDLAGSPSKRELVAALVDACGHAGTTVVAKGVETAAQAAQVAALGCDLLQGYFLGRPGPLPGG